MRMTLIEILVIFAIILHLVSWVWRFQLVEWEYQWVESLGITREIYLLFWMVLMMLVVGVYLVRSLKERRKERARRYRLPKI